VIQTIRLDHLLREEVATPYRHLVTRRTGAAVRSGIERALAASACHTALLDFTEVDLLDLSCADEIVAKLLMNPGPASERCVVLQGLREDQLEAVEHVLNHHRLAVAAVLADDAPPDLLGCADDDARAAFAQVRNAGPTDVPSLAGALAWAEPRARAALDALASLRLARFVDGLFHPVTVR
jgi:hypothetical protein